MGAFISWSCANAENTPDLKTRIVKLDRLTSIAWGWAYRLFGPTHTPIASIPNASFRSLIESPPVSAFLFVSYAHGNIRKDRLVKNIPQGVMNLDFSPVSAPA